MRPNPLLPLLMSALSGLACMYPAPGNRDHGVPNVDDHGVAVVELFTSEGCSSCPPADAVVKELAESVANDGRKVYVLAFHVDYWDRSGWRDRFSDADWSARQRAYAARLPGGVYTPEAVVNGRSSFVGSDRSRLQAAVAEALASPASVHVEASAAFRSDSIEVTAMMTGERKGEELVAVLVEDGLSSIVGGGENSGRRLEHARVVRTLAHTSAVPTVRLKLDASAMQDKARAHVIVLVQDENQGEVRGAAEAQFNP